MQNFNIFHVFFGHFFVACEIKGKNVGDESVEDELLQLTPSPKVLRVPFAIIVIISWRFLIRFDFRVLVCSIAGSEDTFLHHLRGHCLEVCSET